MFRLRIKHILIIFTLGISTSVYSVMMGQNRFIPVDDSDIADKQIDEDLRNIIRRVVQVKTPNGFMGSGFLTGSDGVCNRIVTSKHNFYESESGNKLENGDHKVIYNGQPASVINGLKNQIDTSTIKDIGFTWPLQAPVTSVQCKEIPIAKRLDIQPNEDYSNCVLIGYPGQVTIKNDEPFGSNGLSMVKRSDGGFYNFGKRGLVTCSVKKNQDGEIRHNCSSSPGAAGGVISCKVKGKWNYVGTNDGGVCTIDENKDYTNRWNYENCFTPDGGYSYFEKDENNSVYGSAGSFVNGF